MPSSPQPLIFCAPTLWEARRGAWEAVARSGELNPLDPPLVLGRGAGHEAWRDLARTPSTGRNALILPRLVSPEWFFARAHAGNARRKAWGGLNRLWTLAKALRQLENKFSHLDFDADDTDALREMASLLALMRRQNRATLPVGDDAYGEELDAWRAAYDEELEAEEAFDFEAAPALFPFSASQNRAFVWPQTLVVDDVGEPWPALEAGLSSLFGHAHQIVGTLVIPGEHEEEVARRARAFWTRHGAQFIETRSNEPRVRLARALLDAGSPSQSAPQLPEQIFLTGAHTPGDEAERIAAHIRREMEDGAKARDFCLLVPDPASSEKTLRAAFRAAGLALDWPVQNVGQSPLAGRLLRLLGARPAWNIDDLHDLLGDGGLKLEWTDEEGQPKRLDSGRLRRAHRTLRGESDEAAWREPLGVTRDWEARIQRLRAPNAARGDEKRAATLAASLDGGDLEGVSRLRELLAPFSSPLCARDWEAAALALTDALTAHWNENAPCVEVEAGVSEPRDGDTNRDTQHGGRPPCRVSAPLNGDANGTNDLGSNPDEAGALSEKEAAESGSTLEARNAARAALDAFRAGVRSVSARESEENWARPASAWAAWLRLEMSHGEDTRETEERSAGVRVLRVGEEGESHTPATRGVFVVGLGERAWPRPRPSSSWPRSTALSLEALRENEAPPLAGALHGFGRLLAMPCPLWLSRPAWTNGVESGASPLWEDLIALFPGVAWPSLAVGEKEDVRPATRAAWLRMLAQPAQISTSTWEEEEVDPLGKGGRTQGSPGHSVSNERQWRDEPWARPALNSSIENQSSTDAFSLRLRALDAMRAGRASTEFIGRYDGVLGAPGRELLKPILARHEERLVVSPSGLEGYARCPIRFFFERVLGLPDESATEDDLSRAESGDLVHRVLHLFRREWRVSLGMAQFDEAREVLSRLTKRECELLGLPPILRRAECRRLIGTASRPGALVRLLRSECLEADATGSGVWAQALHPLLSLATQGSSSERWALSHTGNGLEQSFRVPVGGALVQGRIDRMDASADGSLLVVLDYKTGSASSLPSFVKGSDRLHFQLAVYILAARQLTSDWPQQPLVAATYLSPRTGFAAWAAPASALGQTAKSAMDENAMQLWLDDTRVQIERVAQLIENGTFNLSLQNVKIARCDGCAQRAWCGQNAALQTARAEIHLGSNVVFLPERIEWNSSAE